MPETSIDDALGSHLYCRSVFRSVSSFIRQVGVDVVRKRVDLITTRLELDAMVKTLGLTETTRFISLP